MYAEKRRKAWLNEAAQAAESRGRKGLRAKAEGSKPFAARRGGVAARLGGGRAARPPMTVSRAHVGPQAGKAAAKPPISAKAGASAFFFTEGGGAYISA